MLEVRHASSGQLFTLKRDREESHELCRDESETLFPRGCNHIVRMTLAIGHENMEFTLKFCVMTLCVTTSPPCREPEHGSMGLSVVLWSRRFALH